VRTGGLNKLNISIIPPGTERATLRLVAQYYFSLYGLNIEYKVNNQPSITIYVWKYACACACVCVCGGGGAE